MALGKLALPKERTKNKRAHALILPATAVAILGSVRRRNSRDTLFGGGANGFNAWSYNTLALNGRIAAAEGKALAPWRIHDLRLERPSAPASESSACCHTSPNWC